MIVSYFLFSALINASLSFVIARFLVRALFALSYCLSLANKVYRSYSPVIPATRNSSGYGSRGVLEMFSLSALGSIFGAFRESDSSVKMTSLMEADLLLPSIDDNFDVLDWCSYFLTLSI